MTVTHLLRLRNQIVNKITQKLDYTAQLLSTHAESDNSSNSNSTISDYAECL